MFSNAVRLATQRAIARTGKRAKIFNEDLIWAAGRQRDSQVERYADKVTPKIKLDEVIFPDDLRETLARIVSEYRTRMRSNST